MNDKIELRETMDNLEKKDPRSELPRDSKPAGSPAQKNPSFMNRAVRNFLFSGIGTVASFVIAFLFAGLTIRYLGVARAGFFMALTALTSLNAFLGDFGLGAPTVRRVAILHAEGGYPTARIIIGSVMTVSLFSALVITLPVLLFFKQVFTWTRLDVLYRFDAFWATFFIMGSYVLTQMSNPWRATFGAMERYDLLSFLDTVFGILNGICGIVILTIAPTMTALAVVRFTLTLARFIVSASLTCRLLHGMPWFAWAWKEIRPMMNFGGWVYFSELGRFLLGRINSLILITFFGSSALPYYEVPQRAYSYVHGALTGQSRFLFPMFASYGENAAAQINRLQDRLRWLMALASGAAYTVIALVGPDLLGRLVNPEFAVQVKLPLYLACIQGFFQAQDIVPHYSSWGMGYGKPNSIIEMVQGILVASTAFFLIPRFGFIGASIAQLWVVVTVIMHIIWVNRLVSPSEHLFGWVKAFISPVVMIGICLLITIIFMRSASSAFVLSYAGLIVGLVIGSVTLILIEQHIFPEEHRWETFRKIIVMSMHRIFRSKPL